MASFFRSSSDIAYPWTKEWPTKEGFYIFYGYLFKGEPKKTMRQVEVIGFGDTAMYSAGSFFMDKSETGEGYFKQIDIPNTDDLKFEDDNV